MAALLMGSSIGCFFVFVLFGIVSLPDENFDTFKVMGLLILASIFLVVYGIAVKIVLGS